MNPIRGLNFNQKLAFLAKDSAVYGGAAALNKAFALVTFPVLTWHLSVEQFGVIDLYNTVVTLLTIGLVMGQDSAVARYFFEHDNIASRRQLISQSLAYQVTVVLLFLPLAGAAIFLGGPSLGLPIGEETTLVLVALQAIPLIAINFSQNILKWTMRRTAFLTVSLGSTIVTTIALVAALIWWNTSVLIVFFVYLVSRIVFGIAGIWLVRGWLCVPKGWGYFKQSLPFALSFGVMGVMGALTPMLERTSIAGGLDAYSLGLYSAGAKVAMLLSLPIGAFQTAWGPFAFASFRDADSEKTFRFVLRAFTCFVLGSVVTLTLVAPLLLKVLAPQIYAASVVFVVWLSLARAVEGMGWITELGISLAKKAHWKIAAAVLGLAVMVVALGLLMPMMGAIGTALAVLLGIGTKALAETVIAERFHPIGWEWRRVLTMLGITSMFGIHATYVIHSDITTLAYLGLVATGFTVVAAIVAVAFTTDEKAVLKQKIQKYVRNKTKNIKIDN